MDVQAANPAPEPAPAKLVIERFADGGIMCLKFSGIIDEQFEGKPLGASLECETLVLDLGGVKKISSFGIREWVDFVGTATKRARVTILIECAPKVVDQLNMVANFTGGGRVFSFYTPFRCDYCDSDHRVLLQIDRDLEAIKSMKLAERPCPTCKQGMYFDDDGATFFSYMIGQDKFALEPEVAAFLASKLDYAVAEGARKLRVDKVIEGRVTYVRLAGDLDRAFPRDKLAEGLEGTVIIDVAAVGKVEPAGAAEWRSFVQMITPGVDQLYLFGVQPTFLEKLCGAEDLGKKAQVLSFALPYACKTCGTRSAHPLDVAAHHEVLKFATAPEVRCATCKSAMQCTATETSMTILAALPKPSPTPELVKSLGVLRERAVQVTKPKPITTPTPAVAVPTVSPIWTKIAIGLGVAVLALAGIVVYRLINDNKPTDKGVFGVGPLVDRSEPVRPIWVGAPGKLGLGTAQATRTKAGIVGIAVSAMSSSQQDAEDDAFEAAVDGIAAELARLANDSTWFATVPAIYEGARAVKLAALARDPASTQSRKEVREGRQITSYRLRSDGFVPAITGKYREVYDTAEGRRHVAFVQVTMFQDDAVKLAAKYAAKYEVLGATVVRMFPLVGWRHKIDHGAIVIGLADGPFKDIGLAERYIVQSINGRDPAGIESFVKIATEEYALLQQRGGTLRLKVQAEDGAMREFTTEIKAAESGTPDPKRPGSGSGKPRSTSNGGVNVWDKYGGNKGSGRDDPTQ